jgi:hypothetical protein
MTTTEDQWKRTLRRAYGVPDVVADEVAFDALLARLAKDNPRGPSSTVDMGTVIRLIVDGLLSEAVEGRIDHLLLPDDLQSAYEFPAWKTDPETVIVRGLRDRGREFSDHGELAPEGPARAVIQKLVSKLRHHLAAHPLAYTALGDEVPADNEASAEPPSEVTPSES